MVKLNKPGECEAVHEDYNTVMKYRTCKSNENYLIRTAGSQYQCVMLEADGRPDLEANPHSQRDSRDLYAYIPGHVLCSSELIVSDNPTSDEAICFNVSERTPSIVISGSSSPALPIPDDQPTGVSDAIDIAAAGIVKRIKVNVEVENTHIGDLIVTLTSPTGAHEILHSPQGGSLNNLHLSFDSDCQGQLSNLTGQSMRGNWVLRVADRANIDTGILVKWDIELESTALT